MRSAFVAVVFALSGCASEALSETTWEVTRVMEIATSRIELHFHDNGSYALRSGTCHGDGTYETDGTRLVVSAPVSTREACTAEPGWHELVSSFHRLSRYSVAGTLVLEGDDIVVIARPD